MISGKMCSSSHLDKSFCKSKYSHFRYYCNKLEKAFRHRCSRKSCRLFSVEEISGKCVLLHPGSGSDKKNFSHQFYHNILNELKKQRYDVRVILGPIEIEKGFLREYSGEKIETPKDVLALADLLIRTSLYIGNDSGVTHFAAYLGVSHHRLPQNHRPKNLGRRWQRRITSILADENIIAREYRQLLWHS